MPTTPPANALGTNSEPLSKKQQWLLLLLIFVAFAVRLFASVNDGLWLDEIWSLNSALQLKHWWEALTVVYSTNSHIANTMWMQVLGFQEYWGWYRLPSVLCGSALIAFVASHPLFGPPRRRLLAGFLMAVSFPFIHFSSEARGYSPAMFCAILAYFFLRRYWEKKNFGYVVAMHIAIALGLLWHLTFVFILTALSAWILWRIIHQKTCLREQLIEGLKLLLPSGTFAAWLYFFYIRRLVNEGGADSTYGQVFLETFGMGLGGPTHGFPALLSVTVALLIIFAGTYHAYRQGSDEWVFRINVLLLAPLALTAVQNSGNIYYRFFAICFPFFYLVLAELIDRHWPQRKFHQTLVLLSLAVILSFQITRTANFLRYGRGDFLQAVLHMAGNTKSTTIRVGSDHDFRNKMILVYYQRFIPKEQHFVYYDFQDWPKDGVDWVIGHLNEPRPSFIRDGILYRFEHTYPYYGGDAGSAWHVFRRIGPATIPDAPSSN